MREGAELHIIGKDQPVSALPGTVSRADYQRRVVPWSRGPIRAVEHAHMRGIKGGYDRAQQLERLREAHNGKEDGTSAIHGELC